MGLKVETPKRNTRKSSILDFMICGRSIKVRDNKCIHSPSDHLAVRWEIEIDFPNKVKQIKVPSRETAQKITEQLLSNQEVDCTAIFLDQLNLYRRDNHAHITKILRPKTRDLKLFEKLLALDSTDEIENTVNEHWTQSWKETEVKRWSNESKVAYRELKDKLKYHLYEKRDGGIINKIIQEDGTISIDTDEIDEQLAKTIEEIQVDSRWQMLDQNNFPTLRILTSSEVKKLLEGLSSNKAVTLDGLSDIIFQERHSKKVAQIFKDLWSINLNEVEGIMCSMTSRLIPLNKVYPEVPNRKQMRPILVCSPLQKLLEARFLPKLQNYLTKSLVTSQTGFVPKMGTQVNMYRTMKRISMRTDQNKPVYGLFIDFANAYNTVPHTLLFHKLRQKECLEEDEIQYLEALYTKYRIRVGKKIIRFNKGVAQGSILSPALFNIFIEDLAYEIEKEIGISLEDVLMYADDILILCQTIDQAKRCIRLIEQWSQNNGMELNKKKSGVVVFSARRAKDIPYMVNTSNNKNSNWTPAIKDISGVPLVQKYKYLGTYLDSKLLMKTQMEFIRKKCNHLFVKLYPYLINASADGRRDMWQTMISPLFNAALVLLEFEGSITQSDNFLRLWIYTFKKFMIIPKTTSTDIVADMMGGNPIKIMKRNSANAIEKWNARRERREPKRIPKIEVKNYLKGIPNDWCNLIKQQYKLCQKCKNNIQSASHLEIAHDIEITSVEDIWDKIKEYYDWKVEQHRKKTGNKLIKVKREVFKNRWKIELKHLLNENTFNINKTNTEKIQT